MLELEAVSKNPNELRSMFSLFPSGVAVLCALCDDAPLGMALSSYTTVSLDPPLVSVCIQHGSSTWATIQKTTHFGLSLLNERQGPVCRQLSLKGVDRFAGVDWQASTRGAVFIKEAVAWMECQIHHRFVAGDHEIIVLAVAAAHVERDDAPLVFHRSKFRKLESAS